MLNIQILKKELKKCSNEQQIIEVKNQFIKQYLNPIIKSLKTLDTNQKKEIGLKIKEYQNQIQELCAKHQIVEKKIVQKSILSNNDKLLNILSLNNSTMHILNQTISEIFEFFKNLNFQIVNGNEVVNEENNFTRLNITANHPARNMHDSLFINKELLLRTHCTANTALMINNNQNDDIRIVSYGNVYRKDDDDATHSHQFMQVDFVWIKQNLNVANLKWLVNNFLQAFFDTKIKTRYRLSFFPFTEPSFEVDIGCIKCNQVGCNICKNSGWIEIMGAGLLHQNVLDAANIKNKAGIAAGIGVERLVMLKYGFSDIRDLYSNLKSINNQFKM